MSIETQTRVVTLEEIAEMPAHPTVLFGGAGAGKSHVATRLKEQYGFEVFDDQETLSSTEMAQIRRGERFSTAQREHYHARTNDVLEETLASQTEYARVIYVNPFSKDRFRREFTQRFPNSLFVLVEAPSWEVQSARIQSRNGSHHTSSEFATQSALNHDRPITIPHVIYRNC